MSTTHVPRPDRDGLTELVIGAAIEVHRHLGPGLSESAYESCLCWELTRIGLAVARQVPIPVVYKAVKIEVGYRADVIVDERLLVEVKAVERTSAIHEAQLLTYLKLAGLGTGLLLNFNVELLKDGVTRFVL